MEDYLYAISNILKHQIQLDVSVFDKVFFAKSLEKRMLELSIATYEEYLAYLSSQSLEAIHLHNSLYNTYTEFYRDRVTFAILEEEILPSMIAKKGNKSEIRIWSVGCSTGQEAYSIMMLFNDIIKFYTFDVKIRLFATDISEESLEVAKNGVYSYNSIQNLKIKHVNRYFEHHNDTYTVIPELRKQIAFSYYDVLDANTINPPESIYGNFDLIICCNLLIYYRPLIQQKIIKKLMSNLNTGSYLVLGKIERNLIAEHSLLKSIDTSSGIFLYERRGNQV
ncbi:CheR family methyltransferase [Fusibacter bizertensis]